MRKGKNPKGRMMPADTYRGGVVSALILLAALAAALALNLLAGALPDKATKIDLTGEGVYSLSEETKTRLHSLTGEVTLTLLAPAGAEDTVLLSVLQKYAAESSMITFREKDPALYPHYAEQFTEEAVSENSVVVESEKRARFIAYEDLYRTDVDEEIYAATGTEGVTTVFVGESRITSAVAYVTGDRLPKVLRLTGHGEAALSDGFASALALANYEVEEIRLLSLPAVPEGDLLLINDPETDLSEEEARAVEEYLGKGGNLLLLTDYETKALPRLEALALAYGMEAAHGLVVEGDSAHAIYSYPYYILPDTGDGEITGSVKDGDFFTVTPMAHGIRFGENLPHTIETEELLKTSEKAYLKVNIKDGESVEKETGDPTGTFLIGAAAVMNAGEENESRLIWFSSAAMTDDAVDGISSGGNIRLILAAAAKAAGQEEYLPIREKNVSYAHLTVPAQDVTAVSILLIGVLPACILLAGGIYLWRRRRR